MSKAMEVKCTLGRSSNKNYIKDELYLLQILKYDLVRITSYDILRDILKKKDEILDAIICKSNWNVRIWTARDFAEKIFKALGLDKEKEKNDEKNEGEEGSGNNNPQGEQNNSVPN